jgi:hypothetical protein
VPSGNSSRRTAQTLFPDTREILRCLSVLTEPNQVVELRLLDVLLSGSRVPVTMSGYFDNREALAAQAKKFGNYATGTYITLNPVNRALLARAANRLRVVGKNDALTTDADIINRRWLPIDVDPVRPRGISSTKEEHDAALALALQIRDALRDQNWPDPILGDSGNGGHGLYNIGLPANDGGLIKRCLAALARRFDQDAVKIDQAVFNPARIWKLYGTVSRKGDNLPDRPHRLARLIEVP